VQSRESRNPEAPVIEKIGVGLSELGHDLSFCHFVI